MRFILSLILPLLMVLFSCNKKPAAEAKPADNGPGYFSIKSYAIDQWRIYHDQPYGIVKTVKLNGKTDSMATNVNDVKWGEIFKVFFATDISDKKFLDQYRYSDFPDTTSMTNNHTYEAINDKLFTRKLNITTSVYTGKITSIYIETAKNTKWGTRTQRLFYEPVKSIIIQEFESSMAGDNKNLQVEYRFL